MDNVHLASIVADIYCPSHAKVCIQPFPSSAAEHPSPPRSTLRSRAEPNAIRLTHHSLQCFVKGASVSGRHNNNRPAFYDMYVVPRTLPLVTSCLTVTSAVLSLYYYSIYRRLLQYCISRLFSAVIMKPHQFYVSHGSYTTRTRSACSQLESKYYFKGDKQASGEEVRR